MDETTIPEAVLAPTAAINDALKRFVESQKLPSNLREAVLYSLLGPGKRMRPLLAWHAAAAVGASGEDSLPAGVAIELIHAFSLVHDDLPGLDNDDLRRGRPTLHKHAGEAMAVLAGDEMLTLAFLALTAEAPATNAAVAARLVRELGQATSAMIVGQVYDTLPPHGTPNSPTPEECLELIHRNKTGALIRCACRMGAVLGLAATGDDTNTQDHPSLAALSEYADAIGLMFQIVDDLLDVTQTTAHLGKKAGKDADAGKLTYPGVFGVGESRRKVNELHTRALAALKPLGDAAEPLRQLASYMAVRTK